MANRNKTAGNGFERKVIQILNFISVKDDKITGKQLQTLPDERFLVFPKLGSTRKLSRSLDAKKVDITVENSDRIDEFPYLIQAKTAVTETVPYVKLIEEIEQKNKQGIPVVFHQKTIKQGSIFRVKGEYAILKLENFIDLIAELAELKKR